MVGQALNASSYVIEIFEAIRLPLYVNTDPKSLTARPDYMLKQISPRRTAASRQRFPKYYPMRDITNLVSNKLVICR